MTPGEGGLFKFIRFLLSAYFLPTFLGGVPAKFHNIAADNSKMDEFATLVRGGESPKKERTGLIVALVSF